MTKIVLIGAGSFQFGIGFLSDLIRHRETLRGSAITLVDTNTDALAKMTAIAEKLNRMTAEPFNLSATNDRTEALPGADFVVISVAIRRNELWKLDFQIPIRHGVKQVLGENGGPGGLFHALRNIPLMMEICHDIERLCPKAMVLNLTNPEGRMCLAATRYTDLNFVGLCHGINMAVEAVSYMLNLPAESIDLTAGGINHFSWVLDMRQKVSGENLYPQFKQRIFEEDIKEIHRPPKRSFDILLSRFLMENYGYWPLPSDDHVGEYLSYAWEFCGLEGYDFAYWTQLADEKHQQVERWATGKEPVEILLNAASGERVVPIIIGVLGNTHHYERAVNLVNKGYIPNLQDWAIVEVPAVVDATGIHGLPIGPLPEPIAAMCRTQISIIDRVVEAGVHGDKGAALQALMLDPVVNSASQAEGILEEMLEVHSDYLPQFKNLASRKANDENSSHRKSVPRIGTTPG
jgi:alpha-galactosidase